jgi:hypothetical protein
MLQLNKSQATNTVAFYPDFPISSSSTEVRFSGSQDYDRSASAWDASVISNVNDTPWVIAEFSGSLLPSASGLYTYDVYELITTQTLLTWNLTNIQWQLANTTWDNAVGPVTSLGGKLTTTRAYISGSDVPVFTQYESPNENGAYITYLG